MVGISCVVWLSGSGACPSPCLVKEVSARRRMERGGQLATKLQAHDANKKLQIALSHLLAPVQWIHMVSKWDCVEEQAPRQPVPSLPGCKRRR